MTTAATTVPTGKPPLAAGAKIRYITFAAARVHALGWQQHHPAAAAYYPHQAPALVIIDLMYPKPFGTGRAWRIGRLRG